MISLPSLRTELLEHLGLDEDDLDGETWSTDTIDLLLNRAFWELSYKFPFREKETIVSFTTTEGTALYACPSPFEALKMLSIEDPDTFEHKQLEKISKSTYENKFVNNPDGSEEDMPNAYVRESGNIRLHPTPDDTYTITMKYDTTLADLGNSNQTLSIPQVWHEIILFGAVWRGLKRLGDHARAAEFRKDQLSLLGSLEPVENKEKVDNRYAGLEVLREFPSEGNPRIDVFGDPM